MSINLPGSNQKSVVLYRYWRDGKHKKKKKKKKKEEGGREEAPHQCLVGRHEKKIWIFRLPANK